MERVKVFAVCVFAGNVVLARGLQGGQCNEVGAEGECHEAASYSQTVLLQVVMREEKHEENVMGEKGGSGKNGSREMEDGGRQENKSHTVTPHKAHCPNCPKFSDGLKFFRGLAIGAIVLCSCTCMWLHPLDGELSPIGEMKGLPKILGKFSWVDTNLRGASQVIFMNNPLSGLLIIIALAHFNWKSALCGILALVSGTTSAILLESKGYHGFGSTMEVGLYGFNAILVGLAIGTFCQDAHFDDTGSVAKAAVVCIIFGVFSTLVMNSLGKWMPMAPLTLPFNICILCVLGGGYKNLCTDISPRLPIAPDDVKTCLRSTLESDCDMDNYMGFIRAAFHGICQIYLVNNTASGMLMLVAIAICKPLAALCALIGSTVGLGTGILLGVDGFTLFSGLYGFNPAMTAVAIGGGIFAGPSKDAFAWAVFASVVTSFMYGALSAMLASVGLPAFTLASCLVTVLHLGAGVNA